MGRIIDSVAGNAFTRRNFLAGSAAFAAALGGASMLSACSTGEKEETLGPDSGPADEGPGFLLHVGTIAVAAASIRCS